MKEKQQKTEIGSEEERTKAKEALARADTQELFALYERAIRDRAEMEVVMETLTKHYVEKTKSPRIDSAPSTPPNAIESMERVALAAIDLARLAFGQTRDSSS